MPQETNLIAIAILCAIAIPIVLLASAVLLRAGVSLYNRLVGGPNAPKAVPEPSFSKAVGIVLLVGVINWLVGTLLGLGSGFAAEANPLKLNLGLLEALTVAGSFALGIAIMAAVLKFVLPTRPMRAVGVSLCHSVVTACIAGVILLISFSISVVLAAMM